MSIINALQNLIPIHVPDSTIQQVIEQYPNLIEQREVRGQDAVVISGKALTVIALFFEGDFSRDLARNVITMTRVLPNVLHPDEDALNEAIESQRRQINDGNSICVFHRQNGYWQPIRYMTVYPYETIENWGEAGTGCSFTTFSENGNPTSSEFRGAGTLLYHGVTQLAEHMRIGLIGTTTGTAAFVASIRNNFAVAARSFIDVVTGRENAWEEICSPCSPENKTFSVDDSGQVVNTNCMRCADRMWNAAANGSSGINGAVGEVMVYNQENIDHTSLMQPCVFRYFVPRSHPDVERLDELLKNHEISTEHSREYVDVRNERSYEFTI